MIEQDTKQWHESLDRYHERLRRERRINFTVRAVQCITALGFIAWAVYMYYQVTGYR